jgi:hypothetical protein
VVLVESEDPAELAVRVAQVESEDPAELAVQVALVESEDPVEAAVLELETVPAAGPEVGIGLVAAELEHGQVVAVPELVQVPAELEHVRAAVPLRTKSVITPHHRGLVPLLGAEEDLAAAEVETTREPAATEAVIAWEVAE